MNPDHSNDIFSRILVEYSSQGGDRVLLMAVLQRIDFQLFKSILIIKSRHTIYVLVIDHCGASILVLS